MVTEMSLASRPPPRARATTSNSARSASSPCARPAAAAGSVAIRVAVRDSAAFIRSKSARTAASTRSDAASVVVPNRAHSTAAPINPAATAMARPAAITRRQLTWRSRMCVLFCGIVSTTPQQNPAKATQERPLSQPPPLKIALKRGALVTAANWPLVAVEFIAEGTFKLLLAVPVVGGVFLVVLLLGADTEDVLSGDVRDIVSAVVSALGQNHLALAAFAAAFIIVLLGGS